MHTKCLITTSITNKLLKIIIIELYAHNIIYYNLIKKKKKKIRTQTQYDHRVYDIALIKRGLIRQ